MFLEWIPTHLDFKTKTLKYMINYLKVHKLKYAIEFRRHLFFANVLSHLSDAGLSF